MAKAVVKVEKPVRTPVQQKIVNVISEHLGVDDEEVTGEATLMQDLGADSLDIVEMVMGLEEEFGVVIDDLELEDGKVQTVQHVFDLVEKKIGRVAK